MNVADFDFDLPRALIADHPARPRDAAKLLVVAQDHMEDRVFRDLPDLLRPGDLLVINDTRVIPARLGGRRGEVKIEITLHQAEGPSGWRAFARPGKRLRLGDRIHFAEDFTADVAAKGDGGEVTLAFNLAGPDLAQAIERHGAMPLPPYIPRPNGAEAADRADYQTIYARNDGAVAAPTAGLHFTPEVLARLERCGIGVTALTLHVGAGTFLPVKVEDTKDHKMHGEWGTVPAESARRIMAARAAGGRIVAVGTTVLRLLESAAGAGGALAEWSGTTSLFVTPGFRFKLVDLLITNFHLPRSTLFMLVSAFAGLERMKSAYEHAKTHGYRFYSFGDASLLQRVDLA
jgi:S-adenosylmethionine:tRNA ribosyltransferase-isomerase